MYLIIAYSGQSHSNTHLKPQLIVTFVVSHRVETCRWWIPVRQPMRALVRLPGPADNAGTGGHRFELTQKPHCAISNTSLLLAREDHPDKKNFALEHCQPVPTIGKPLEWRMNDHLSWHNWPLNFVRLVLHANFGPTTVTIYGIRVPVILPEAYFLIAITLEIRL